MKPGGWLLVIFIILLVFLPFTTSSGKVFWSRLMTRGASLFDPSGDWRQIYKCPLLVNGSPAALSVYGSDDSLPAVTAKLKKHSGPGNENQFTESPNSTMMSSTAHDRISRLLMLSMPASDNSVIFEFTRQISDMPKSPAPSAESVVFGRSPPAGSSLATTIRNEETGATLESFTTSEPPGRTNDELSGYLSRNGWENISPAGNESGTDYFQIYRRGNALCVMRIGHAAAQAGQALRENKTCVTILLKEIKGQ